LDRTAVGVVEVVVGGAVVAVAAAVEEGVGVEVDRHDPGLTQIRHMTGLLVAGAVVVVVDPIPPCE
jgi:hypothetical protein